MEALLTLAFAGWLGKKTVEAVVGGGNKKKRRRSKTNRDRSEEHTSELQSPWHRVWRGRG